MSAVTTPSLASLSAMARPKPRVPPVITAILPLVMLLCLLPALSDCQLFGGTKKKAAARPPKTVCPSPADPALLGIAPELRNEVLEAARAGVVVVRYRTEGCLAELAVQSDCKLRAA